MLPQQHILILASERMAAWWRNYFKPALWSSTDHFDSYWRTRFPSCKFIFLCLNLSKKNHPSFFILGFARALKDFKQHQLRVLNWAKKLESLPLKLKKKIIAIFPKSEAWKLIERQELRQNTILEVHSEQYYNLIVTYLLKNLWLFNLYFYLEYYISRRVDQSAVISNIALR